MVYRHLEELENDWRQRQADIEEAIARFRRAGRASDEELFSEMVFCLLAIQTSARRSDVAARALASNGLLWRGTSDELAHFLRQRVRFHNHKARYLVAARERFFGDEPTLRTWLLATPPVVARECLVREVDGFGHKEASHFLRNVGRGQEFAILDRHVLKNLRYHGVLRAIPESLTPSRYLAIEERVGALAERVRIPMEALDLVFWSRETGEVFK